MSSGTGSRDRRRLIQESVRRACSVTGKDRSGRAAANYVIGSDGGAAVFANPGNGFAVSSTEEGGDRRDMQVRGPSSGFTGTVPAAKGGGIASPLPNSDLVQLI